jgi:hypothetical protein
MTQDFVDGPVREFVAQPVAQYVHAGAVPVPGPFETDVAGAVRLIVALPTVPLPPNRYVRGVVSGEVEIVRLGSSRADVRVRGDVRVGDAIRQAVELQLREGIRVVVGSRSAFGVQLWPGFTLDAEVNLRDQLLGLAVTANTDARLQVAGIPVQVVAVKLRLEGTLTAEGAAHVARLASGILARMAPWAARAAAASGPVLLMAALPLSAYFGLEALASSREQGGARALLAHARHGYAYHLACLATGADSQQGRRQVEEGGAGDLPAWRQARELGWQVAEVSWAELEPEQAERLQRLLGPWRTTTWQQIYQAIGGAWSDRPLPHARAVADLIAAQRSRRTP